MSKELENNSSKTTGNSNKDTGEYQKLLFVEPPLQVAKYMRKHPMNSSKHSII